MVKLQSVLKVRNPCLIAKYKANRPEGGARKWLNMKLCTSFEQT